LAITGNCKISILTGSALLEIITQTDFIKKWDDLFRNCPWATAFQDYRFVKSWYEIYKNTYEPLMVISENENSLLGIFPLTIGPSGKIKGAGHEQAEYQVWLSRPGQSDAFFVKSIEALRKRYPGKKIHLKYIPHQVPLEIIKKNKMLDDHCFINMYKQPIMEIDPIKLNEELKKKNKKEKINRLKRLGELSFEKITCNVVFSKLIDKLTIQNDFRKGAMYNKFAFWRDRNRKDFMISLFEKGMLHVTILKINNEIIASNAGVYGNGIVHLQGINSHSPFYEKYSPGILHFLMLGQEMDKEGLSVFDFTPGKELYKEMLSTKILEAHELVVCSTMEKKRLVIKNAFKNSALNWFNKRGVEPMKLKSFVHQKNYQIDNGKAIFRLGPINFFKKWWTLDENRDNVWYYKINLPKLLINDNEMIIHKNELSDFFKFNPEDSIFTLGHFFSDAMSRMKFGHQVFTYVENDILIACLWFVPESRNLIDSDVLLGKPYSLLLFSLYSSDKIDKIKVFLAKVVEQLVQMSDGKAQMIFKVNQHDKSLNKTAGQLGFEKLNYFEEPDNPKLNNF